MEKLIVEIHEDVVAVLAKIRAMSASEVELVIPEDAMLFDNGLNLKLIKKECEKLSKKVVFLTTDIDGKYLISLASDSEEGQLETENADFNSHEVSLDEVVAHKAGFAKNSAKGFSLASLSKLPSLNVPKLPTFNLSGLKMPKLRFGAPNVIWAVVGIVFAGLILGAGSWFLWTVPKASIQIAVNSQPLVKSLQISVENGSKTNASSRLLEGRIFSATVTQTAKTPATGKKMVGEKAKGTIKIVNRTTSEKEFKKGEKLHSKDDDELLYVLDDEVTVPAAQPESPDPLANLVPGSAEVDVTAEDIGKKYNLDENETLEFEKYKTSDYVASAKDDISGGMSEEVKVVIQADLDKLTTDIAALFKDKGTTELKSTVQPGWVLVGGSETTTSISKKYSKKVDETSDDVELTETVNYQGLGYSNQGLNSLLEELLSGFVPSEFELSDTGKEIKAEVLGNTDKTSLTLNKADLQVTIKANIVPIVDSENIKESLLGVTVPEAEKILSEVKNVHNYGLNISPNVPFFKRIPKNPENVEVAITLE